MKSAAFSGVILLCIVLIIVANSFYCVGVTDNISKLLDSENTMTEGGAEALENYWNKRKTVLCLGVSSNYIDSVSESIISLKTAIKTDSKADAENALYLLRFRIERLQKLNRLDFINVF